MTAAQLDMPVLLSAIHRCILCHFRRLSTAVLPAGGGRAAACRCVLAHKLRQDLPIVTSGPLDPLGLGWGGKNGSLRIRRRHVLGTV